MKLNQSQINRYSRQTIMPEIGKNGQKKLLGSRVLVIGAGGLGSSCLTYLTAAGIGNIGIIDFDKVAIENLHRQIIHSENTVGQLKVESAKKRILEINSDVKVIAYNTKLTPDNAPDMISGYDIVADCTDNIPSRYLINDACFLLNKPFVHAAVIQFYGQLMTILPDKSACYRCLMPEPPPRNVVPGCKEAGVIGTVVGITGVLQANEIIKFILGAGSLLSGKLLIIDLLNSSFEKIPVEKNPDCKLCGNNPTITDLVNNQEFYSQR
jgi:molybdopterin/thiamine biosynthesis adenylyltransferase